MLTLISTLIVWAAPSQIPWTDEVLLGGFLKDGTGVVWSVDAPGPLLVGGAPVGMKIITDPDGTPLHAYRYADDTPSRAAFAAFQTLWAMSRPASEKPALTSSDVVDPIEMHEPITDGRPIPGGKLPLTLSIVSDHQRCPTHILVASLGPLSGAVAEDSCRKGEERSNEAYDFASVAWAPSGDRAAIAWNTQRSFPPPLLAGGKECPDPDCLGEARGYMVIISRRSLASVDLLDAGAGDALDALADKLQAAKFRVGHRGKAGTPRKSTELYFAPGFEPEAKELTALLGLPATAAKPLTWKTPYSLTLAAAAGDRVTR